MKQYIDKRLASKFKKCLHKIINKKIGHPNKAYFGVAGNTFRAYRGYDKSPGEIYKLWAKKITPGIVQDQSKVDISVRESFLKWHKKLYNSLQGHWKKHQCKKLPLAHCYKLVDLYIKWLSTHRFENEAFLKGIITNANCALDSQTLKRLNECYSMALPIFKPSMGHIHNQNTYDFCQALITEFSAGCGGTRLLFDYWTWQRGNANKTLKRDAAKRRRTP